jgi:hypothetical protein
MNEYQDYLDREIARNEAELFKQLNVSRAWITKVHRRGTFNYENNMKLS